MLGYIKLNTLQSLSEELADSQVFELYFQAMARKRPVEVVESFGSGVFRCSEQASIERQHPRNDHLTFACKIKTNVQLL